MRAPTVQMPHAVGWPGGCEMQEVTRLNSWLDPVGRWKFHPELVRPMNRRGFR
jgi:hypothetical protein